MKSLRKYLSVFCVVSLLIFCGVPGVAAESDGEILWNTYPTTAEVSAIIEAEQPLVDLYQEMVGDFAVVDGNIVYPEEYAGAYIENGKLNINITDCANTPLAVSMDDNVVFHEVQYSYNDLHELYMMIIEMDFPYITSIGVSDRDNEIHIGINEELLEDNAVLDEIQEQLVEQFFEEFGDSIDTCVFGIESFPIYCFWEKPITSSVTLQGGMTMTNSTNGATFSLGICGKYYGDSASGDPAVLSCGHDMTVGDTIKVSGTTIGTIAQKNFTSGERYDYGITKITNTSSVTTTNRVLNNSNYTTITGVSTSNPVGTTVCKYGINGFSTGIIIYSDRAVYYSGTGYIHGLVHVAVETSSYYTCGAGDSGGAIYRGHDFYGVYSGDDKSGPGKVDAKTFYYSPIYGVTNFSVATS